MDKQLSVLKVPQRVKTVTRNLSSPYYRIFWYSEFQNIDICKRVLYQKFDTYPYPYPGVTGRPYLVIYYLLHNCFQIKNGYFLINFLIHFCSETIELATALIKKSIKKCITINNTLLIIFIFNHSEKILKN